MDFKTLLATQGASYIIAFSLFVIVVMMIFASLTGRLLKFKVFGQEFDFGGISKKKSEEIKSANGKKIPPHAKCLHSRDFLLVINRTTYVVYRKAMIETKALLESQMVYAEEKSSFIIGMLQEKYQRLLKGKDPDMKPESHIQYRYYCSLLRELIKHSMMLIKHSFLENGLKGYDEKNIFNRYANEKADYMIGKAMNWMSEHYPTIGMLITFDELVKSDVDIMPKIKDLIVNVFNHALSVVKEKQREIQKLEEDLDKYIQEVVGIENS